MNWLVILRMPFTDIEGLGCISAVCSFCVNVMKCSPTCVRVSVHWVRFSASEHCMLLAICCASFDRCLLFQCSECFDFLFHMDFMFVL